MSDFEYEGVSNNQLGFREKATGMSFWLLTLPEGDVEMLDGDQVRFQPLGGYQRQVWSIRENRPIS